MDGGGDALEPTGRQVATLSRPLSAAEFLLGAGVVIGHNVFRVVPNEVIILFVAGMLSVRLRDGGLSAVGLNRPASWPRIFQIALAAAAVRIVLGEYVVGPLTSRFWPPAVETAGADEITGHPGTALLALLLVWTFAAFGEEFVYRGYLLLRAADVGGRTPAALLIAMILTSILFGYGHYYKGPAGVVDSGMAGLILGTAYLVSGRNLWACVLGHGFIDTFAVVIVYLGWST